MRKLSQKMGEAKYSPRFLRGYASISLFFLIAFVAYDSLRIAKRQALPDAGTNAHSLTDRECKLLKLYRQQHAVAWEMFRLEHGRLPHSEAERTDYHNIAYLNALRMLENDEQGTRYE